VAVHELTTVFGVSAVRFWSSPEQRLAFDGVEPVQTAGGVGLLAEHESVVPTPDPKQFHFHKVAVSAVSEKVT